MSSTADLLRAATSAALAGAMLLACDGGPVPESTAPADIPVPMPMQGMHVTSRDDALQVTARGIAAPLAFTEMAHAVLARAFELRAADGAAAAVAGERWQLATQGERFADGAPLSGQVAIEIEAADRVEGLLLRGEAGSVRATLRFDDAALGTARIDGAITLESSRAAGAAGWAQHRSDSDALHVVDAKGPLNWSHLHVSIDAQRAVQEMAVVSDVPVGESQSAWLDVLATAPGHYVAEGVAGFVQARLRVHVATDGGWTIEVDNGKDASVDLRVRASAAEARTLMPGP